MTENISQTDKVQHFKYTYKIGSDFFLKTGSKTQTGSVKLVKQPIFVFLFGLSEWVFNVVFIVSFS